MDSNTQKEAMPTLCAAGCGFFSNPNLDDLCSKCNRERQGNEAAAKAIASSAPSAAAAASPQTAAPAQLPLQAAPASQPTEQQPIEQPPAAEVQTPVQPPPAPSQSPTAAVVPPPVTQLLAAAATAAAAEPKLLDTSSAAAAAAAADGSSQQQQAVAEASEEAADDEPPRRVQKNTNRCFSCNKKVGLTGFKCRCGFVFCGPHRLAEAHGCDYDYKGAGRETLAKLNPLVQADRVTRF